MTPRLPLEDDFVLTISDDDTPLPYEEEDELEFEPAANGLKRKRDENQNPANGKNKKPKKGRKDRMHDDESNFVQAKSRSQEDDGAMDSDFEFQIGNVDTGVVEDFDGWGTSSTTKEMSKQGDKKGVNIDELIARRRVRKRRYTRKGSDDQASGDEAVDGTDLNMDEAESDAKEGAEELRIVNGEVESDDELLAPDGFGMGATAKDDEDDALGSDHPDEESAEEEAADDDDSVASPAPHPDDLKSDHSENEEEDAEEKARQEAFFAPESQADGVTAARAILGGSFQNMSLSRPILRGLAAVGFSEPTPIQAKTIPVALRGQDVVGGAVTGSGKTAAFMIPILERLLYRPRKMPTSRVAILMPTRELAVQCFNVAKKLASFTDVTFCQLVGGFSLREQENVLRTRPDVIIATPGRFIDHMRNSASFTLDTLEILVLDEADRMLEDGFADELNEILTTIPKSRQTMLFSATMTNTVDKLIRVGLNRPVRLMVDAQKQTVGTLVQEFVRLRPGKEDKRLAYLLHLCSNVYADRCIIFFRQKKEAHRVRVIFGLFGFRAGELHGSMTQEQRISSVESFRNGTTTHLLATDVASRGLDIKNVSTVLNYEAPQSHEIYLHRVGRTARAGRSGRACTIAAEPDRKVVKAAVRAGKAQGAKIVSRTVESSDIDTWEDKIHGIEQEIDEILAEEKEERALGQADMRLKKGENMIDHEQEIMARPKRTWFETEADKKKAKAKGNEELNGQVGKGKKGKLSNKDKKRLDDRRERKEGKMWKKGKGEGAEKSGLKKVLGKGGKRPQKGGKGKGRR